MLVSEDDGADVVESLNKDGLLSSIIEDWRLEYIKQYETWFSLGRDLNRTATKLWIDHWRKGEGESAASLLPVSARVLGRALSGFASSLILCERGLAIDAANLARSIIEASFWLSWMERDAPSALSALEADDLKSWIASERELQKLPSVGDAARDESKKRERAYVDKLGPRKRPEISEIAEKFGSDHSYLNYRILSGHYAHTSQTSIKYNFLPNGDGTGMNILGPHAGEIPKSLYFSCVGLIDCGTAYAKLVKDDDAVAALSGSLRKVNALRDKA